MTLPPPVITAMRPGASKPDPFTICIVSNPVLALANGALGHDPINTNQTAFDDCADYIHRSLFGAVPGQSEQLLAADPAIAADTRVLAVFLPWAVGTPLAANCLVAEYAFGSILDPRQYSVRPLLSGLGIDPVDIVFVVSASATHTRAATYQTSDDSTRPGDPFTMDGRHLVHQHFCQLPGTVAIHESTRSLTALHEFGHAIGSVQNGEILDLYVDSPAATNVRLRPGGAGSPIPGRFGSYAGTTYASDPTRDSLGYDPSWRSFHCELIAAGFPAAMDNYKAAASPLDCEHDRITRGFILDRVRAKIGR